MFVDLDFDGDTDIYQHDRDYAAYLRTPGGEYSRATKFNRYLTSDDGRLVQYRGRYYIAQLGKDQLVLHPNESLYLAGYSSQVEPVKAHPNTTAKPLVVDVDNHGTDELIVEQGEQLAIWSYNGRTELWDTELIEINTPEGQYPRISHYNLYDVDRDGFEDLVIAGYRQTTQGRQRKWRIHWLKNQGGRFDPSYRPLPAPNVPHYRGYFRQLTDFDGNGTVDYYLTGEETEIQYQFADSTVKILKVESIAPNDYNFNFVDVTGDGLLDLISNPKWTNSSQKTVHVHIATGTGTFASEPVKLGTAEYYYLGDQDENGITEIYYFQRPKVWKAPLFLHRAEFDPSLNEFSVIENAIVKSGSIIGIEDFDGDGVLDYIGQDGNKFLEYLSGTEEQPSSEGWKEIPIRGGLYDYIEAHAIVGNFNGDKRKDFLISYTSNEVGLQDKIFISKPEGQYVSTLVTNPPASHHTRILTYADLNEDGLDDRLTYSRYGLNVQLTDRRFSPYAPSYTLTDHYTDLHLPLRAIHIGDLNQNGRLNAVVSTDNSHMRVFEFRPGGESIVSYDEWIPGWSDERYPITFTDADGDGKNDLVVARWNIAIRMNTSGSDTISFERSAEIVLELPDTLQGTVTDVVVEYRAHNDELHAVFVANNQLYVASKRTGEGHKLQRVLGNKTVSSEGLRRADIDGDGRAEFIAEVKMGSGEWTYAISIDGDGASTKARLLAHQPLRGYNFEDVDDDGDLDARLNEGLMINHGEHAPFEVYSLPTIADEEAQYYQLDEDDRPDVIRDSYVYFNEDATKDLYSEKRLSIPSLQSTDKFNIHIYDINADGVVDLLFSPHNSLEDPVWIATGTLYGSFDIRFSTPAQHPYLSPGSKIKRVADFDEDGFGDFLAYLYHSESTQGTIGTIILGNPDLSATERIFPIGNMAWNTMDWDGDGDLDFISRENVFINKLSERDTLIHQSFSPPSLKGKLAYGDFNDDGRLDIISVDRRNRTTSSGCTDGIWWQEQSSTGSFSSVQKFSFVNLCRYFDWVEVGDWDNDGDNDVLLQDIGTDSTALFFVEKVAGSYSQPRQVLLLNGQHQFGEELIYGDLNEDGRLDILYYEAANTVSSQDNLYAYMDITGKTTRHLALSYSDNTFRRNRRLADLNMDGSVDLFMPSTSRSKPSQYALNLINAPRVEARLFLASRYNEPYSSSSTPIRDVPLRIRQSGHLHLSDKEGIVRLPTRNGNYIIEWVDHPLWELHQDVSEYDVVAGSVSASEAAFAVRAKREVVDYQPSITSDPTRCGFSPNIYYTFKNTGTVPGENVSYSIQIPDAVRHVVEIEPQPATIDGNVYTFSADSWQPTESKRVVARLQMPGVTYMGKRIPFVASITPQEGQTFADTMWSEIRCGYDPNDKLVHPNRGGEHNYLLFKEWINYTVRFQNTGNDTAFSVRITDQIDTSALDVSTFEFIQSSHDCKVSIDAKGMLSFQFDNILLPDSTTNEPLSHGLVQFRIRTHPDLDENTILQNKANIYFDFNRNYLG
jgi:hypothetical protein